MLMLERLVSCCLAVLLWIVLVVKKTNTKRMKIIPNIQGGSKFQKNIYIWWTCASSKIMKSWNWLLIADWCLCETFISNKKAFLSLLSNAISEAIIYGNMNSPNWSICFLTLNIKFPKIGLHATHFVTHHYMTYCSRRFALLFDVALSAETLVCIQILSTYFFIIYTWTPCAYLLHICRYGARHRYGCHASPCVVCTVPLAVNKKYLLPVFLFLLFCRL